MLLVLAPEDPGCRAVWVGVARADGTSAEGVEEQTPELRLDLGDPLERSGNRLAHRDARPFSRRAGSPQAAAAVRTTGLGITGPAAADIPTASQHHNS